MPTPSSPGRATRKRYYTRDLVGGFKGVGGGARLEKSSAHKRKNFVFDRQWDKTLENHNR